MAQHLCVFGTGIDAKPALREFLSSSPFNLHVCITADIEATELRYIQEYGSGETFYFRLRDHEHGQRLAKDFFYSIKDYYPEVDICVGEDEIDNKQLYLFIKILCLEREPALTD
jgi:hypothetical protein